MSKVSVNLVYETDFKEYFYRVQVWSEIKPKLSNFIDISIKEKNLPSKITMTGGALAENLCKKYKDTLDPSKVAQAAYEAFIDLELDLRRKGLK